MDKIITNPYAEILSELSEIKEMIALSRTSNKQPATIELIDRNELLKRLGISEPTCIRWVKKKTIPELTLGGNKRYNWAAVVSSLEKQAK